MKKINLWESDKQDNYIFFTDTESYFKYLDERNLEFHFKTRESYIPTDDPECELDKYALNNNVEFIYTDNFNHPIACPKGYSYKTFINPTFFKEHLEEFKKYAIKYFNKQIKENRSSIIIPNFIFSNDILTRIINTTKLQDLNYIIEEFTEEPILTEKQIKLIKENHLQLDIYYRYKPIKKISSKNIIGYYSINYLKIEKDIHINLPIDDNTLSNFIYLNSHNIVEISQNPKEIKNELNFFNNIKEILKKLSSIKNTINIKIKVINRQLLKESNLLSNIPSNINLYIETDYYLYDIKTYQKEEEKLEKLVKPIRESNLSTYKKYLAIYNIVKNFKPYKENNQDRKKGCYLRYILDDDNEYIVCYGYASLFSELLNKVGIPNKLIAVFIDVTRDKEYVEGKDNDISGHARNIVKLDDDEENIHGYYIADTTWDSNTIGKDLYLNSTLTFDRKKEAYRLEQLSEEDLLLDFHNFEEFITKINYFLKEKEDLNQNYTIRQAYINLFNCILKNLNILDYNEYSILYNKYYNKLYNWSLSFSEFEKIACDMLTEYAEYIIPLSNNNVNMNTILNAATIVKKEIDGYTDSQIKEWLEKATKDNEGIEKLTFPYIYNPEEKTEAYVRSKAKKRSLS